VHIRLLFTSNKTGMRSGPSVRNTQPFTWDESAFHSGRLIVNAEPDMWVLGRTSSVSRLSLLTDLALPLRLTWEEDVAQKEAETCRRHDLQCRVPVI
jgi:hypothetical protein